MVVQHKPNVIETCQRTKWGGAGKARVELKDHEPFANEPALKIGWTSNTELDGVGLALALYESIVLHLTLCNAGACLDPASSGDHIVLARQTR